MRISLIGPVYPYRGGIAHHTMLLAQHLGDRHAVQVISFRRQYPRWLFGGRSDRDPSLRPLRADAEYLLDPLDPITWWKVARRVATWRPDALILPWWVTFWSPAWLALSYLVHRWTDARVLFVCHNVLPHEGNAIDRVLARSVLSQGDAILVQSQQGLALARELVPNRLSAWVPHPSYAELGVRENDEANQLSQAAAQVELGLNLPPGQPVLLHFGFIRPYKGLAVLLDAMPLIQTEMPVHLLVAGEVWGSKAEYDAQIARLHIDEQVTFVDRYVPDEELASYFRAADVAVLPYLSATQSGVVQLAFGFGLPVIASNVGGLPDVIRQGETGLLVPPGDPSALAQAVLLFFRAGLGPSMTANIMANQARFSWEQMVTAIEELLMELR